MLRLWMGTEEYAQMSDGVAGEMTGLGRDVAIWTRAARAWPALCKWPRRGLSWWWSKAANDGLGDAVMA